MKTPVKANASTAKKADRAQHRLTRIAVVWWLVVGRVVVLRSSNRPTHMDNTEAATLATAAAEATV